MSLVIEVPPVPLRTDEHGVMRVGKTRVPLDTVVYTFNQGSSPEEIVMSYPSLELGDVYAVVNYAECSLEGEWEGQVNYLPAEIILVPHPSSLQSWS